MTSRNKIIDATFERVAGAAFGGGVDEAGDDAHRVARAVLDLALRAADTAAAALCARGGRAGRSNANDDAWFDWLFFSLTVNVVGARAGGGGGGGAAAIPAASRALI
jgi:hypothetical protein